MSKLILPSAFFFLDQSHAGIHKDHGKIIHGKITNTSWYISASQIEDVVATGSTQQKEIEHERLRETVSYERGRGQSVGVGPTVTDDRGTMRAGTCVLKVNVAKRCSINVRFHFC